jgi:hypothetical protein
VVTSLAAEAWEARALYEQLYCARGEMENRNKEQLSLFRDRMSTEALRANHLRLYFFSLAYVLLHALRRLVLAGTEWARAQVATLRLRLLKIAAEVRVSARHVWLRYSRAYPWKTIFAHAWAALRGDQPPLNRQPSCRGRWLRILRVEKRQPHPPGRAPSPATNPTLPQTRGRSLQRPCDVLACWP